MNDAPAIGWVNSTPAISLIFSSAITGADSGFYAHAIVAVCRKMDVRYSITIRQHKSLRHLIEAIPETDWTPIPYWMDGAADVAETAYRACLRNQEVGWGVDCGQAADKMPLRDMDRERIWLLPPSLDELLPLDHPARFVAELVDGLDREGWAELGMEIEGDPRGAPAYHPRALLCVWLYGFMTGMRSCRKLEAACRDQIPYLWLTGWQHPDHNTLWRFYKAHRQAMRELFKRTVCTAVAMELVDLAVQAVDGSKVAANATKDRTYDAERGGRLLNRLEKAIADLEAQNEAGEDAPAVHLPEALADKRALRKQVRQAMDDLASQESLKHINLTDKDARLMKTRQGIVPSYNGQAMVSPVTAEGDLNGMLITAVGLVDEPDDHTSFTPMLEQAEETTGSKAPMTLADAVYYSGTNLEDCAGRGQAVAMPESSRRQSRDHPYHKDRFAYDESNDSFMCPQGKVLPFKRIHIPPNGVHYRFYQAPGAVCRACPAFGVCTKSKDGRNVTVGPNDAALRRHRTWMATSAATKVYKLRKQVVEPVFGIVKEQQGGRRFLLRGLTNVAAEWTVLATAFNLRTLCRVWRARIFDRVFGQSQCPSPWPPETYCGW